MDNSHSGSYFRRRIKSFGYALSGVAIFFKETSHARIHLIASILVVVAGFYFHISMAEWILVTLAATVVFTAEALNSALEYSIDLATSNFHPLAKKAKDVAAGAVLLASLGAAVVGALVFVPKLLG